MNHGAHDDPTDYGEVPGHAPTVILSHLDGNETVLPRFIEARLRAGRQLSYDPTVDVASWKGAREHKSAPPDEPPPPRGSDDYGTDDEDESVDESPAVMAPIYTAFAVAVCVQVLVQVLLVAFRVGGAVDWPWGWVLAPMWVPSTVATVLVTVICLWLAAVDEREAAHRRNLVGKGN